MPYLLARSGSSCARLQIPHQPAVIGRSQRATLRVGHRSVSKLHASIEPVAGGERFVIRDLGSSNGLLVADERRESIEVGVGDEFRLGQVSFTVCGEGPETLRVPELVARTSAEAHGSPGTAAPWGSLLDRSERRLVVVLVVVVIALGVAVTWMPPWGGGSRDPEPAASSGAGTAAERSAVTDAEAPATPAGAVTEPDAAGSQAAGGARAEGAWTALAVALDGACSDAGCHAASDELDFRETAHPEPGRWERNLRVVRRRGNLVRRGDDWLLAAFADRTPHDREIALELDERASAGAAAFVRSPGRLLRNTRRLSPAPLAAVPGADLVATRRAWLLLRGRLPTIAELIDHRGRAPTELLALARSDPELWRERARRTLRGRDAFPARGGFSVPDALSPHQVPADLLTWRRALERERERGGATHPHPYGDAAPLPEDADDLGFQGWFLQSITDPPRPLPADVLLRSAWSVLHGRPPDLDEERLLAGCLASGIAWEALAPPLVALLVHAPALPAAGPESADGEGVEEWVAGVARLVLGRDLGAGPRAELAARLRAGDLDPRVVLEEAVLGMARAVGRAPPVRDGEPEADGRERRVDIEVICGFPVRELLREPRRIPRLWRRLERAHVQTFTVDPTSLEALLESAPARALEAGRLIVSHRSTLGAATGSGRVRVADGFLLAPLRELVDRLGDPDLPQVARETRSWVRERLGLSEPPTPSPAVAAAGDAFRAGGYRLVAGAWQSGVYRPATRTLLVALTELAALDRGGIRSTGDGNDRVSVWVELAHPPAAESELESGKEWSEFATTLELLALEQAGHTYDLWLWGPAADGEGSETVRITWGPRVMRGIVEHTDDLARRFHPLLRASASPEDGNGAAGVDGVEEERPR